jgi:hypothetical protein
MNEQQTGISPSLDGLYDYCQLRHKKIKKERNPHGE